jgi:hypothetical protein
MPLAEWERWGSALPLPSFKKTLSSQSGSKVQAVYELKYKPITSGDWYSISNLRRSYQSVISEISFDDHLIIEGNGWEATGELFKLSQLQVFPSVEVKYPTIIKWARSKKTFRGKAFFYCKRLKYEGLLSYPAIMAALLAMNSKLSVGERMKVRTLERLVNDILVKSDEWVVKLSKEALHIVKSDLGKQRAEQLQAQKEDRVKQIKEAVSSGVFTKPSGAINQKKLAEFIGVHRNTIINLLPLVMAMMILIFWIRPAYDFNPLLSISLGGAREGGTI